MEEKVGYMEAGNRMLGTKIANGTPCKSCGVLVYKQTRSNRPNETGLCRACWRKSKRGANSSWYNGGTWTTLDGYKMVRIYEEDFFYSMADKNGYVREHRLVMAKHLNRNLHSWESVHHKDGDKQNNTLSNLELLNKNQHMRDHNKGYKDGFEKGLVDGRKETLKKVVEWGEEMCLDLYHTDKLDYKPRRSCYTCWQALLEETK